MILRCQEIAMVSVGQAFVPKPTQVDEENILRRSIVLSLRNSAKLPRNFGRRGAPLRRGLSKEALATV